MVTFRSFTDIVLSMAEYLRLVQPNLDTKPGTVARDLFIDAPAGELSESEANAKSISNLQSFFNTSGTDLERLGANFGLTKSVGTRATGTAVFTTNSLELDTLIEEGTIVTARNGVNFKTTIAFIMRAANANVYRATATRLRAKLELAGITDMYAVEVPVQALTTGTSGNLGQYALISQNLPNISNVTNLEQFSGGSNAETDTAYRARVLSVFAGSNTGTALGYETAIQTDSNVSDALVVEPGNPLMTRDGTEVTTNDDGELVITNQGTGGKVDIYVLGTNLVSSIDSFIYNDQSGTADPSNSLNDVILGQGDLSTSLITAQRRVDAINNNQVPLQPIYSLVSVQGSSSGSNFVEQYTDTDGVVKGNYTLLKDTGAYGGSPFGFDKLHWISGEVELSDEEVTKGIFNGVDALQFSDVNEITAITQNIFVTNENSTTSTSNRSSVQLKHKPVLTVSRVLNLTTGERYVISSQNPDGTTGELNTTGRITISGSTLPVATDVLQVDYTWVKPFDSLGDFDNLARVNNNRVAQDSVDWSYSNLVEREPAVVGYGGQVTVTHPVSRVISVSTYTTETASVVSGVISMSQAVTNVVDMRRVTDGVEVYNTDANDGALSGTTAVVLPSDTLAATGESVVVRYNALDLFEGTDGYDDGSYLSNIITLPENVDAYGEAVLVDYIADVNTLLPTTDLSDFPVSASGNYLVVNGVEVGAQPVSQRYSGNTVTQNLRKAPTFIRADLSSIGSAGTLTLTGTTMKKVSDVLVRVTSGNGYDINLSEAIKADLVASAVPSTVSVARLAKVERLNVAVTGAITSVDNVYDVRNYRLKSNTYDLDNAVTQSTLSTTTVSLPRTSNNTTALLVTGDILRVTFYYVNTNDSEQLYFSRNGTMITNKAFYYLSRVSVASGFLNNAGVLAGEVLLRNTNQPIANTSYQVDYNYVGPKENERITVTYTYNDLIRSSTNTIESVRPVTADVLVKEAEAKDIDITMRVVLLSNYVDQEQNVIQDLTDSTIAFLNANSLGTTVDASDVVANAYTVTGIDRVTIYNFSSGSSGNVQSISANSNQYLRAGTITVARETR